MKYNNTLLITKLICRKQLLLLEYIPDSQNRRQLSDVQEKKEEAKLKLNFIMFE